MIHVLRYAMRQLLKCPGFTAVAVLTLALGIGANTAIFSVVNTVLLRPLPYSEPDRLVRIYSEFPSFPNGGLRRFAVSAPEYLDLRRETKSWGSFDAWASGGVNVGGGAQPTRATATQLTGGLLPTLGARPLLGRLLTPEDDVPGGPPVAVISHGLWQRAFAGDRAIVGRDILVNGRSCTVVGVMPPEFQFPPGALDASELWAPLQIDPANPGGRSEHSLNLLGRLRPGVTPSQAQAELASLAKHWGETGSGHRFDATNHTLVSHGLHDEVVRGVRPALRMLLGAVAFLLLIACVNVANLLLARAESRQREIAIRGALGAGLGRLTLQFVMEGLLLSSAGVVAGLLLAYGGLELIKSASEASVPRAVEIGIDGQVILFAVVVSLVTGVLFGLVPLAHAFRRNLQHALKSAATSTTGTPGIQRFRQALVVGELALALTLLIGTGLMLRAFWNLQEVDAGFDPKNVVTMSVELPDSNYRRPEEVRSFWTRLEQSLAALPGVEQVALASGLPPVYPSSHNDTLIEGFVPTDGGPIQNVEFYQSVSPGYFEALRLRLVEGRFLDRRDDPESPEVVVINQTMARTFWGNSSAVGRRIRPGGTTNWCTVVGVVADAKNGGLEKPTGTELYLPFTQSAGRGRSQGMHLVLRTAGDSSSLVTAVRQELAKLDPTLPLTRVRTMDDLISQAQSRPRFLTLLLTLFAGVALVLATVGIYGVISYSVARQTKEFGLRMALGGQRRDMLGLVLGRGLVLALVGIGIGLVGALFLTRFLSSLLFGVTATDPATFFLVSLALGAVAVLASYVPARRAMNVDPMVTLRHE
ncbi:MAG: ABC transporter permease [Verrucomicrobiales bacterium]|nr:ABC transporter permease [Verrucomicrobiales bacterium]